MSAPTPTSDSIDSLSNLSSEACGLLNSGLESSSFSMASTADDLPDVNGAIHPPAASGSSLKKPHIFDTIQEPVELRKMAQDAIYLVGGQFAILCQFAHPALAEGAFKHSNFAGRVVNRLQTTSRFLFAAIHGTQEEKEAIFGVIHRRHASVKGAGYDADDPELHKWTAATLLVSLITVHETFFGKVSRPLQERWFREAGVYGTSLRMPPDMWPATLDEFWRYWQHNIDTLHVTDWARSLAADLLWPRHIPVWLWPVLPAGRLFTAQWLPERLQREYGLTPSPLGNALFHFTAGYTALIYPYLPMWVRQTPARFYMQDMKRSVEMIQRTGHWPRG
ncbi:uncharacterized protein PpBr36_09606 [Pyricularia pennisetigena]|uniref:uncharacterized protein n=1 Tax=Pyricularia pennisetigena TaxID=1578925 RepID=UPI0011512EF0|nr:uncharacterized protein PpBr36_09606 [Pyricularia pennisetigena]TLS21610.1 hypothetical protein PpBr36_09606 [Pyricularia pennisetigena]